MAFANKKKRALNLVLRNKLLVPSYNITGAKPKREKPAAANAPAYSLSADIPKKYNDTYIRAIPKDPQNTFVYWEVPKEKAADSGIPNWGNIQASHDKAVWIHERVSARRSTPDPQPWPIPKTRPSPPEITMPPASAQPETQTRREVPKRPEALIQNWAADSMQRQEPWLQAERSGLFIPTAQASPASPAMAASQSLLEGAMPAIPIPAPSSGIFYNNLAAPLETEPASPDDCTLLHDAAGQHRCQSFWNCHNANNSSGKTK